jgi:hypothetical protein
LFVLTGKKYFKDVLFHAVPWQLAMLPTRMLSIVFGAPVGDQILRFYYEICNSQSFHITKRGLIKEAVGKDVR